MSEFLNVVIKDGNRVVKMVSPNEVGEVSLVQRGACPGSEIMSIKTKDGEITDKKEISKTFDGLLASLNDAQQALLFKSLFQDVKTEEASKTTWDTLVAKAKEALTIKSKAKEAEEEVVKEDKVIDTKSKEAISMEEAIKASPVLKSLTEKVEELTTKNETTAKENKALKEVLINDAATKDAAITFKSVPGTIEQKIALAKDMASGNLSPSTKALIKNLAEKATLAESLNTKMFGDGALFSNDHDSNPIGEIATYASEKSISFADAQRVKEANPAFLARMIKYAKESDDHSNGGK